MKTVATTLFAFGLLSLCSAAFAAGEGTAVGVDPDATARLNNSDRILEAGTDVSVGELIVTGPAGQVQILFDDQTRLVVGPGSSLLIETYLLANDNTAEKLAINALGGSFRFITGTSPKPAYSVKTPTAAIAVRGTEFDLVVTPAATGVLLYEGALQLCGASGACEDLVNRCDLGTISNSQTELLAVGDADHRQLTQAFRYARFQSGLLNPFKVDGAMFCTESRPETGLPAVGTHENDSQRGDTGQQPTPRPRSTGL